MVRWQRTVVLPENERVHSAKAEHEEEVEGKGADVRGVQRAVECDTGKGVTAPAGGPARRPAGAAQPHLRSIPRCIMTLNREESGKGSLTAEARVGERSGPGGGSVKRAAHPARSQRKSN